MVKEIGHYSLENPATIFDEEAMTALELAARTAGKVNECIKEVNAIPEKVAEDVQAHIDNGDFDKAINAYAGDLSAQVNYLIGRVPEGSTTMDAEIIDARRDPFNNSYASLGTHIRVLSANSIQRRAVETADADVCTGSGFYLVGSSDNWVNLPNGESGGCLSVFNGEAPSRRYQFFQSYNDALYVRHMTNEVWQEWKSLPSTSISPSLMNGGTGTIDAASLDDMRDMGMYRLGSSGAHDAPDTAGLLFVYNTGITTQCYQMFMGYNEGMFFRSLYGGAWTDWKRVGTVDTSGAAPADPGLPYTIQRVDSKTLNIFLRGTKGFTCYRLGRQTNAAINLDTVRLQKITLCDKNKYHVATVSDIGHDIEGAILEADAADHIGGVHGDEIMESYRLFIGGVEYTLDNAPSMNTDNVEVWVTSTLNRCDTPSDAVFKRVKRIKFKPDGGVEIRNAFEALADFRAESLRGIMFSINKSCFTHYTKPNYGFEAPELISHNGTTGATNILYAVNASTLGLYTPRIDFLGGVNASVEWRHTELWQDEWTEHPALSVYDYGDRIKVYISAEQVDMLEGDKNASTHTITVRY